LRRGPPSKPCAKEGTMLSSERLAEIRALTWEWKYEDCSDHQSAVNDLLAERDQLAAEGRLLREALEHCHVEYGACCQDCPMCYEVDVAETAIVEHCLIQDGKTITPLIAAEVERVKRLEAVADAADKDKRECVHHGTSECYRCPDPVCAALAAWREGEAPNAHL